MTQAAIPVAESERENWILQTLHDVGADTAKQTGMLENLTTSVKQIRERADRLCLSLHGDGTEESPGLVLNVRDLKKEVAAVSTTVHKLVESREQAKERIMSLPWKVAWIALAAFATVVGGAVGSKLLTGKADPPAHIETHTTVEAPHP